MVRSGSVLPQAGAIDSAGSSAPGGPTLGDMPSSEVVEIGAEPTPIAAALGTFLERELSVYGHSASVSLEAAWQALLEGSLPVATPMFLVPRRSIDLGTDLDVSDPDSFVREVQDAVSRWRTVEDPVIDAGAAVVFRVTICPAHELEHAAMLKYAFTPG